MVYLFETIIGNGMPIFWVILAWFLLPYHQEFLRANHYAMISKFYKIVVLALNLFWQNHNWFWYQNYAL